MAMAAVPKYLGSDFSAAAPGHRFGMYLSLWGVDSKTREALWTMHDLNYRIAGRDRQERQFKDENKTGALKMALALNPGDREAMQALALRQHKLAEFQDSIGHLLCLEAVSVAPFATGLGNEHPLENGFAFLNPYGLPYLAGSGIKGVLRCAAQELAAGKFGGTEGWTPAVIEALFGRESQDSGSEHQRGALMFWDVIPQISGASLTVEVMTPHQSHYYQKRESPHESGGPIPINFVTVPPGSGFCFHVQCNRPFLKRVAPLLADNDQWKILLGVAFRHAFEWLGFGAKTAVGYGALTQLSAEAVAAKRRETVIASLRCAWVDQVIGELSKKHKAKEDETLRGAALAEAWKSLTDNDLKSKALADIRARWTEHGWWDAPPKGAARKAKEIYDSA